MSAFATATFVFAASVGISALIFIVWAGILYHRVLGLPPGKRKHGLRVLDQLTGLLRTLTRLVRALTGLLRALTGPKA